MKKQISSLLKIKRHILNLDLFVLAAWSGLSIAHFVLLVCAY